jgi:hypothetical protein
MSKNPEQMLKGEPSVKALEEETRSCSIAGCRQTQQQHPTTYLIFQEL